MSFNTDFQNMITKVHALERQLQVTTELARLQNLLINQQQQKLFVMSQQHEIIRVPQRLAPKTLEMALARNYMSCLKKSFIVIPE